ncbi:MAG: hypothetical protein ACK5LP_07805 [Campylobacteraceae bacterium]
MRKVVLGLVSFMLVFSFANAGKLDFSEYGFNMDSFSKAEQTDDNYQIVQLAKPISENGFVTNANVIIQKFEGTMKEYFEVSNEGFKFFDDFKTISSKYDDKVALWEYTASFDGQTIHFVSKAFLVKEKGLIYLVTAASGEDDWKKDEKDVRRVVDSFKLK